MAATATITRTRPVFVVSYGGELHVYSGPGAEVTANMLSNVAEDEYGFGEVWNFSADAWEQLRAKPLMLGVAIVDHRE